MDNERRNSLEFADLNRQDITDKETRRLAFWLFHRWDHCRFCRWLIIPDVAPGVRTIRLELGHRWISLKVVDRAVAVAVRKAVGMGASGTSRGEGSQHDGMPLPLSRAGCPPASIRRRKAHVKLSSSLLDHILP